MTTNNKKAVVSTYKLKCDKCDLSDVFDDLRKARIKRKSHETDYNGHKVNIDVETTSIFFGS